MKKTHPLNDLKWVHRETLKANGYNPNRVAPPELKLLKTSILEDGWTQPIVINPDNTIVDGFHRWTVSGHKEIYSLTDGLVPVVVLNPQNHSHQQMSTIRHNRARGEHHVLKMSDIVREMVEAGISTDDIIQRVGMEREEVIRLLYNAGVPKSAVFANAEFSQAWKPGGERGGESFGDIKKKVNAKRNNK